MNEPRAVPEGFTLPWNTTRTLADVWAGLGKQHDGMTRSDGKPKKGGGRPKDQPPTPEVKAPFAGSDKHQYVLRAFDGSYLHQSCDGMTKNQQFAWRGTGSQLARVRHKFPDLIASEVA